MNNCEQYGGWMADAALGALDPRREGELLAHAGECEGCRQAYRHARELTLLVDRGVEALVAGEPSPHLAARLRARIAEEPDRPRLNWLTWKPAAAMLAVALLVAALAFFGTPRTNPQLGTARIATGANSDVARSSSQPRPRGNVAIEHRTVAANHHAQRPLVARRKSTREREPEVIVPPGQLEAVMQLAADIRTGRIDGKQFLTAQKQAEKPLKIDPIEIVSLAKPQPYLYDSPEYTSSDEASGTAER
jgi:hypothetical protein